MWEARSDFERVVVVEKSAKSAQNQSDCKAEEQNERFINDVSFLVLPRTLRRGENISSETNKELSFISKDNFWSSRRAL